MVQQTQLYTYNIYICAVLPSCYVALKRPLRNAAARCNINSARLDRVLLFLLYVGASHIYIAVFSRIENSTYIIKRCDMGVCVCAMFTHSHTNPASKPEYHRNAHQHRKSSAHHMHHCCAEARGSQQAHTMCVFVYMIDEHGVARRSYVRLQFNCAGAAEITFSASSASPGARALTTHSIAAYSSRSDLALIRLPLRQTRKRTRSTTQHNNVCRVCMRKRSLAAPVNMFKMVRLPRSLDRRIIRAL